MTNRAYYRKIRKNNPIANVDALILNKKKQILLLKRNHYPYKGYWVLPGGAIEGNEKVEKAVLREVKEETGLKAKIVQLIGVYSGGNRDPRYPSISITFHLKAKNSKVKIDWESEKWQWFSLNKLPPRIGFDHRQMILDLKRKL